ncbi:substrate-binding domain-containing protein [Luteibacter aegosomaticola]|uniref:substrate-binding domain-containing protein n=1 Tax=Luteibacter aegosomaticola TaxID=2911538 RepID=UPI001FF8A012|nr:substrate-binding domain-containing protein [Luteibacter aegosomaticola]UPG88430.1 substrate-binding domain-containing protein [Luteibacter aegosomaticola]
MKFIAGAVLMSLASAAAAQSVNLTGGGATLPQLAYTADNTAALTTPLPGSMIGAYSDISGNTTTYCPTGSGTGKKILAGNDPANNVNNACLGTPAGFGGTGLTQPAFVGSDSPLASSDMTAYFAGHTALGAQPVQFPSIAGAIAVSFNKAGVSQLNLTETQVCQVFSGQIKTWQALRASGANTGIPSSTTGNITVVYRSDGSGTSFNFSNHLSAVCGAAAGGLNVPGAGSFQTNQDFSQAIASYLPSGYAATATASGNTGVVTKVGSVDGAIGYAEVANVVVSSPALYASIENKNATGTFIDPSSFGPSNVAVSLQFDKAIGGNDANGRPQLVALSGLPKSQCIAVVDPSAYASPAAGYPIMAVTYLLGNATGNGSLTAGVRGVLGSPYSTDVRNATGTVGFAGTGFAWLDSGVTQSAVDSCVN